MARSSPPIYEDFAVVEDTTSKAAKSFPKLIAGFQWIKWLLDLDEDVAATPSRNGTPVRLTAQVATIPLTPLPALSTGSGVYRINYVAAITQAATVSSDLTVTFTWTHNTVVKSISSILINGNTTTTINMDTFPIRSDAGTPISYSAVYNSVGATPMQFSLDVVLESLALDTVEV